MQQQRTIGTLFAELRRRKVFRAVAAYAVVAFIALQVAELVFPAFEDIPEQWYTWLVIGLAAGFPTVALLAWVYELTPAGIRHELPAPAPAAAPALEAPDGFIDSVAVLPFADHSPDKDQEYFVDGMTEALIGKLARLGELRVISRTSVMRFRDSDLTLPEIAAQLGVRAVVEGSVMRIGDKVRIEAQLIDAHNDDHLWAESYDGGLEDVLSLQSEVALTAAKAIKATVSPQEQRSLSATPEISPEAYQLYLKGLHAWNKCNRKALQRAEQLFRSALEVDPGCALVHSALADTYSVMMFYNYLGGRDALPLVRHEAQEAIRLDESLAQAHASLAWAHLWEWKFEESEAGFLRALELNPNYGNARHWYANLLCFQGRGEESIEQMQAAMQVDPLSAQIANSMGWTYYVLRRYGESIRQLEQVLELDPAFANAHLLLSLNYLERGDRKLADHHVRKAIELDPGQPEYELFKAYVEARLGRSERARESLRHAQADVDIIARSAIVHVALDEHALALDELERALDEQPWTVLNLKLYPWYDPLRDEPRFQALVDRLGLG